MNQAQGLVLTAKWAHSERTQTVWQERLPKSEVGSICDFSVANNDLALVERHVEFEAISLEGGDEKLTT